MDMGACSELAAARFSRKAASFQVYSTRDDIDRLADGLVEVAKLFGG